MATGLTRRGYTGETGEYSIMLLGSACAGHAWRKAGLPVAIGNRLLAGFGLGKLVFVVSSMVYYKSTGQLAETTDWVRHTYEVLAKLQKLIPT